MLAAFHQGFQISCRLDVDLFFFFFLVLEGAQECLLAQGSQNPNLYYRHAFFCRVPLKEPYHTTLMVPLNEPDS